jgi:hypothetical protein
VLGFAGLFEDENENEEEDEAAFGCTLERFKLNCSHFDVRATQCLQA